MMLRGYGFHEGTVLGTQVPIARLQTCQLSHRYLRCLSLAHHPNKMSTHVGPHDHRAYPSAVLHRTSQQTDRLLTRA